MECLSQTARWLGDQLRDSEHFEVISDGSAIPVVSFRLAGDPGYTEFDVSHALRVLRLAGARLHHAGQRHRHRRAARRRARGLLREPGPRAVRRHRSPRLDHLDELKPRGHFDELQPFAH